MSKSVISTIPRKVIIGLVLFVCLWLALGQTVDSVLAATLPDSETQALNEWPNWVANQCTTPTTSNPGNAPQVSTANVDYTDSSRSNRKVGATVYLPGDSQAHPLIMFAPGRFQNSTTQGTSTLSYGRYLSAVAAQGFVVVGANFSDNNSLGAVPADATDIKFLISQVEGDTRLSSKITTANGVGLIGHSDGGMIAMLDGYASGFKDTRLTAVMSEDGAWYTGYTESSGPPLFLMHGTKDIIQPISSGSNSLFSSIQGPYQAFAKVLGADHYHYIVDSSSQYLPAVDGLTGAFFSRVLGGNGSDSTNLSKLVNGQFSSLVSLQEHGDEASIVGKTNASTSNTGTISGGVPFDDSQSSDTGNQTTIDDDGVDPSPTNSPDHQSSTSYADGRLGALHTNYIALNPGWASANGLVLGDVAALTYKGKTAYAVYGDNHVGNTVHAEISVAAAKALGTSGNDSLTGVHYVVYPGTYTQLAGSVDQSKIDQIGAQASGGVNPGSPQCSCTSSGSGSGTSLSGGTPAEQAFNYYVQHGLSPQAAAGLVGNFMSESGGDTEKLDPTITNGIGAHGIAQWYQGRLTNLISFANSHSEPEDSLPTQLDFSWQELSGPDASVLSKLKTVSSASQAADIVNSDGPPSYAGGYEGSGVAPNTREANATKLFGKYASGSSPGANSGTGSSAGCPSSTTTSGPVNIIKHDAFGIADGLMRHQPTMIGIHYTGANEQSVDQVVSDLSDPTGAKHCNKSCSVQITIDPKGNVYQLTSRLDVVTENIINFNNADIGIEIMGADEQTLLSNSTQFNAVVSTVTELMKQYNIKMVQDFSTKSGLMGHIECDQWSQAHLGSHFGGIYSSDSVGGTDSHTDPGETYMSKLRAAVGPQLN